MSRYSPSSTPLIPAAPLNEIPLTDLPLMSLPRSSFTLLTIPTVFSIIGLAIYNSTPAYIHGIFPIPLPASSVISKLRYVT